MKLYSDHSTSEQEVRIELIPLIDVIFCILTFFILAAVTLTRQTAINVDLPRASTGATQLRELLIVSVDPIGQTYIEKQPVSKEQLYEAMLTFRQTSPDGLVVLYASRAASYNDVVTVLDLLRSVGGSRVALATLPGSASGSEGQAQFPDLIPSPGAAGDTLDPYQLPGLSTPLDPNSPLPGLDSLPGAPSPANPTSKSASPSGGSNGDRPSGSAPSSNSPNSSP